MNSLYPYSTLYLAYSVERIDEIMIGNIRKPRFVGRIKQPVQGRLLLLLLSLVLVACATSEQITATGLWGRPSPGSATNAAFYGTIHNHGAEFEELVAADIDICGRTELHESTLDENSIMSMHHIEKIAIPPGGMIKLEPGGLHIMCIDRQADLDPGDLVPIRLQFLNFGELSVKASIREQ